LVSDVKKKREYELHAFIFVLEAPSLNGFVNQRLLNRNGYFLN